MKNKCKFKKGDIVFVEDLRIIEPSISYSDEFDLTDDWYKILLFEIGTVSTGSYGNYIKIDIVDNTGSPIAKHFYCSNELRHATTKEIFMFKLYGSGAMKDKYENDL